MVRNRNNKPNTNFEKLPFAGKYSMKNIPIPKNNEYMKKLIGQMEKIIKRMRWKALFFLKEEDKQKDKVFLTARPRIKRTGSDLLSLEDEEEENIEKERLKMIKLKKEKKEMITKQFIKEEDLLKDSKTIANKIIDEVVISEV